MPQSSAGQLFSTSFTYGITFLNDIPSLSRNFPLKLVDVWSIDLPISIIQFISNIFGTTSSVNKTGGDFL